MSSAWNTRVTCVCGGDIYAFVNKLTDNNVSYGYVCKTCRDSGLWTKLARSHFGF